MWFIISSNFYGHGQLVWKLVSCYINGQEIVLRQLTVPPKLSFPFDIYTNVYTYVLCYIIISLIYLFGVYMYFVVDSFYIASLNYCRAIFLLISRKIQIHFKKFENSPAADKNMQKELKEIVELHIEAFQLVQDLEKVANIIVLIMLIILSFAVCLNGFAIVSFLSLLLPIYQIVSSQKRLIFLCQIQ